MAAALPFVLKALPFVGKAAAGALAGTAVNKLTGGGVKDAILGTEGQPASVVNGLPADFAGLTGPLADVLKNIIANPGDISYKGPYVAGMSPGELQMMDILRNFATQPTPGLDMARDTLSQMSQGTDRQGPLLAEGNLRRGEELTRDILSGATFNPTTDSILQRAIEAANRPLERRFEDEYRNMRGQFTAAGQYIGPNASSPFEYAQNKLKGDLAFALGDTTSNIVSENLKAERQRQGDVLNLQSTAVDNAKERQRLAAAAVPAFDKTVLEGIISSAEALALPRLIEQLDISMGKEEFDRQQSTLVDILRIIQGVTSPNPVAIPGSEGTTGAVAPAAANAISSKIVDLISGTLLGDNGQTTTAKPDSSGLYNAFMGILQGGQ